MEPAVPVAVTLCHELLKWILPILDRMPRTRRYGLGARLENALLEVLGRLVAASYTRDKREDLRVANRELAIARHLWRLCLELQLIAQARHQHGAERMLELGRQIGGWTRHAAPTS